MVHFWNSAVLNCSHPLECWIEANKSLAAGIVALTVGGVAVIGKTLSQSEGSYWDIKEALSNFEKDPFNPKSLLFFSTTTAVTVGASYWIYKSLYPPPPPPPECFLMEYLPQRWEQFILYIAALGFGSAGLITYLRNKKKHRRHMKKDVVLLHELPRGIRAPSTSSFCLKLETYLRVARIPYETDFDSSFDTSGSTPWITLNGEDMCNAQQIIESLGHYYGKSLSSTFLSDEQTAIARSVQVLVENHLLWGVLLWRFVYTNLESIPKIINCSWHLKYCFWSWKSTIQRAAAVQGIGGRPKNEVEFVSIQDLRALSDILGDKRYLFGSEPCEVDCATFGVLAQVVWNMPGSAMERVVKEELPNLLDYCERIKRDYWPDWESCLDQSTTQKLKSSSKKMQVIAQ